MAELIDTHCHLTTLEESALLEVFQNAERCGVKRMLCVGAGEGTVSAEKAVQLAERFPFVVASVGIHPHDASEEDRLSVIEGLLSHPKVVAIGETGLDFFRDWAPKEKQFSLFQNTIELAKKFRKPIIIHCRDAVSEVLQTLRSCHAETVGGVFHCYSETAEIAKQLWDLNFLVSFTGNITFKKAQMLRDAAKDIPLEQIMLETDSPYMAPEPFRGKPSEPMHVYQVALQLAEIKGISIEDVARITTNNAIRLFNLK